MVYRENYLIYVIADLSFIWVMESNWTSPKSLSNNKLFNYCYHFVIDISLTLQQLQLYSMNRNLDKYVFFEETPVITITNHYIIPIRLAEYCGNLNNF